MCDSANMRDVEVPTVYNTYAAFQFVLPDASESLLFVFGHGLRFGKSIPNLCLESLDADKTYAMTVYGK